MPVWHKASAKWVKDGKLTVIGITQEQHPQRCRLFAQWKKIDFPIAHDPITVLGTQVVPIFVALDEHGIVRRLRPDPSTFERDFLDKKFEDDAPTNVVEKITPALSKEKQLPDFETMRQSALKNDDAKSWRRYGDALYLWGKSTHLNEMITAYENALKRQPKQGPTLFRLGACYRRRYEMKEQSSEDFQRAVDYWDQALLTNPNQYVWRRRIQQYGPRLEKPYPFYDWVDEATRDIVARGEKPIALQVPLIGAEIAKPTRKFSTSPEKVNNPDPTGYVNRDKGIIESEVTVVPKNVRPGSSARVHVSFYPNRKKKAHWNNEAGSTRLWINVPEGWQVSQQLLSLPRAPMPASKEKRSVDFEVKVPREIKGGRHVLKTFALYYVCEDKDGKCLFLRHDLNVTINVKD